MHISECFDIDLMSELGYLVLTLNWRTLYLPNRNIKKSRNCHSSTMVF